MKYFDELKKSMNYCKRCIMPDTRPDQYLNAQGVCNACLSFDYQKKINWELILLPGDTKSIPARLKINGSTIPGKYACNLKFSDDVSRTVFIEVE